MNAVEAYASATSVAPGERIDFHVRIEGADQERPIFLVERPLLLVPVRIYRAGGGETLVHPGGTAIYDRGAKAPTPGNAYEKGCGWPVVYSLTIPDDWSSGAYIARFFYFGAMAEVLFVVKAASPGMNSKILFELTFTTYQAYNNWGGKSLYDEKINKVSFNRPTPLDYFQYWELPFIAWLEANGFEAEYATSIDLHADPNLLNNYQLLLSVGHDEYWSKEMRDNVEVFVANGGNVAFFSGNVCWWQVRFEDNNRTLVCYRYADVDKKENKAVDDSRVTVNWKDPPVNRPENSLTGVSFVNGAMWLSSAGERPAVNYIVRFWRHWVFDKTGLNDSDGFGADNGIVGYETDAALFCETENGVPYVTGNDGTPLNFLVLATADCTSWGQASRDNQSGMATMGLFRNRGTVFTAATTDWSRGLMGDWNVVSQITENILRRLSSPCPPSPHIANSGFERWTGDNIPEDWVLEGQGTVSADHNAARNGQYGLVVDATTGQAWISQGFDCERRNYYRVGCWARADSRGATIRLQSTTTWRDFAIAEHSGNGEWEYLCAVGMLDDELPLFPTRVKIQVANGVIASFDDVSVDTL
jgi:hypothetical protein